MAAGDAEDRLRERVSKLEEELRAAQHRAEGLAARNRALEAAVGAADDAFVAAQRSVAMLLADLRSHTTLGPVVTDLGADIRGALDALRAVQPRTPR